MLHLCSKIFSDLSLRRGIGMVGNGLLYIILLCLPIALFRRLTNTAWENQHQAESAMWSLIQVHKLQSKSPLFKNNQSLKAGRSVVSYISGDRPLQRQRHPTDFDMPVETITVDAVCTLAYLLKLSS